MADVPFLAGGDATAVVDGAVDFKGRPASRSSTGGWRSAAFIIGVEMAERAAYSGVAGNLITYLTGPMGQTTAAAAAGVNAWSGAGSMLPLLGAFLADSYLGRYRTIVAATVLYILGLGLLTMSAMLPSLRPPNCSHHMNCPSPSTFQKSFLYAALYIVALAQGGHKPCTQAFGADQFDASDPKESQAKSSFFNWWYFGTCFSSLVFIWTLTDIQDKVSWGLGFGLPCIAMVIALFVFLFGTKTYRFTPMENASPFVRIGRAFTFLIRQRIYSKSSLGECVFEDKSKLNEHDLEEAEAVLQLFPIWAACIVYAIVFAQSSTFFTKQGSTMDRRIWSDILVSPANLQCFIGLAIVIFLPIYDRIFVPIMRTFTGKPSGISMLQRIGAGICLSILSMVLAAITEVGRLKMARNSGLVDRPDATIPMSVWWLLPQYVLFGIADVFTMVGLQEFFYDQIPIELRSVGLSLYLSIIGIGSFLSSFLVSVIDKTTSAHGDSWFANNLNRAHLDYFYWLLAGLSTLQFIIFMFLAKSYTYKAKNLGSTV